MMHTSNSTSVGAATSSSAVVALGTVGAIAVGIYHFTSGGTTSARVSNDALPTATVPAPQYPSGPPAAKPNRVYKITLEDGQYTVRYGDAVLYEGNRVPDLAREILKHLPEPTGAVFFLDVTEIAEVNPAKATALVASVRWQAPIRERQMKVHAFQADASNDPFSPRFMGTVTVSAETIGKAPKAEYGLLYQGEAKLSMRSGPGVFTAVLHVAAKTQKLVEAFFERLRSLLRSPGAERQTFAEIVARARDDLHRNHQFSDDQLRTHIRSDFGELQIVELFTDARTWMRG